MGAFGQKSKICSFGPKSKKLYLGWEERLREEVKVLVDENKEAGPYTEDFNGAGLAGGIYIYKIQAGSFAESKKMVLLK